MVDTFPRHEPVISPCFSYHAAKDVESAERGGSVNDFGGNVGTKHLAQFVPFYAM